MGKRSRREQKRMVGIDLFSGAGGMSLGAQNAGIELLYAVEKCPHAAATYKMNFPKVKMHVGDIREVRSLPPKPKGASTVVFGGPPCQGFSTSNQRTRNADNPNNWLFEEFVRLVSLWKPDWVVMENVKGITETDGGRYLEIAAEALTKVGYDPTFQLLNAVDHGVPQRRTRLFIVGSRHGIPYEFPQQSNARKVTVANAIGDLPNLRSGASANVLPYFRPAYNRYAREMRGSSNAVCGNLVTNNAPHILRRYAHVPPGGNWENIPKRLMQDYADVQRCHTGIYRRLHPNKPSVVIGNFRKNMLIHPSEDRGLSVREAARLQGIPDPFRFTGSIGFQQQQVGNMVPPLLAQSVFEQAIIANYEKA